MLSRLVRKPQLNGQNFRSYCDQYLQETGGELLIYKWRDGQAAFNVLKPGNRDGSDNNRRTNLPKWRRGNACYTLGGTNRASRALTRTPRVSAPILRSVLNLIRRRWLSQWERAVDAFMTLALLACYLIFPSPPLSQRAEKGDLKIAVSPPLPPLSSPPLREGLSLPCNLNEICDGVPTPPASDCVEIK